MVNLHNMTLCLVHLFRFKRFDDAVESRPPSLCSTLYAISPLMAKLNDESNTVWQKALKKWEENSQDHVFYFTDKSIMLPDEPNQRNPL